MSPSTAAASRHATDWAAVARGLSPLFAERATDADDRDLFVADNYESLKASGLVAAGVPAELGGGGADHAEMCGVIREIARHCGSTSLAFAMHVHLVMAMGWRWRHRRAPVDALLRRVAAERMVLVTSGGSDWLHSSGTATRVEGGYRVNARKIFASGSPAGGFLLTSAVYDDPQAGETVLHFGLPMTTKGMTIEPTWRAMGMRATASNDIVLSDVFVPDAAVGARRPRGRWDPLIHVVVMVAMPLIYSTYVGIAEAARDRALLQARRRKVDSNLLHLVGGMENELALARLALADMIATAANAEPGRATTNRIFMAKSLAARAAIATAGLAMEAAGGAAYFRGAGLERLFRDVQAARYHPLAEGQQRDYAGRVALDLDTGE